MERKTINMIKDDLSFKASDGWEGIIEKEELNMEYNTNEKQNLKKAQVTSGKYHKERGVTDATIYNSISNYVALFGQIIVLSTHLHLSQ